MWYTLIDTTPYIHPILVLTAFLLGAQVPNIVRIISSLSRFARRILP